MARALLVGCGCRARAAGELLCARGWQVRGSSRRPGGLAEIERAGIEPVLADPDRVGTVLEHVGDVTVLAWLLGSAQGGSQAVAALHGRRLERTLEQLVDTPVRGLVYEAVGAAGPETLEAGWRIVAAASRRWRIPVRAVEHDPSQWRGWAAATADAVESVLG